jgi:hypothetical protein
VQAVLVAGGTGGAAGANNGLNGGDSSVGSLCIGRGGAGGVTGNGGAGGVGGLGVGDITTPGTAGDYGLLQGSTTISMSQARGGGSIYGQNAIYRYGAAGNYTGLNGAIYGCGGNAGMSFTTTASVAGGNGANGLVTITEYGDWAGPAQGPTRGALHGLTLSTAGGSTTFTIAPGEATDSTFVDRITVTGNLSKTSAAFAAGGGNGALDTGTIATTTWYHVYVIKNQATGAFDALISLSATAPTLPSGYNLFRRIGSLRFDGTGNCRLFHQRGDEFLWDVRNLDLNAVAISTTATTPTLTVPTGIQVNALFTGRFDSTTAASVTLYTSPDESDQAPGGALASVVYYTSPASSVVGYMNVRTDTSARIRMRSNGTGATASIYTYGWIDDRGRNA